MLCSYTAPRQVPLEKCSPRKLTQYTKITPLPCCVGQQVFSLNACRTKYNKPTYSYTCALKKTTLPRSDKDPDAII